MVIYLPIEIIFNSVALVPFILIELGILVLTLFFNHKKWFGFSRIYFFIACIISILPMMYVVPEGAGNEFLLLPLALLPGLIFHNRWLDISFFLLVVTVFYVVLETRGLVEPIVDVTQEQINFFRNIYLGVVFLLSFTIIFYFRTLVNNFEEINKKKTLLLKASNDEIKASINYAKRIQQAILPPMSLIEDNLPQSFIYYRPKDIIAGDFYWMHLLPQPNGWDVDGDIVLFAAADCTGHGVPGAMVSVVCNNALNQSVKEFGITQPSLILEKSRDLVIETFAESIENVQDGMDISIRSLNRKTNELQYAGANNPIWIIRKNGTEVEEIKANKQPIGKCDLMNPFTNHTIQLNKGDTIYLFSDGYADQFGGPKGKKFKSKPFKNLLLSISNKPLNQQKELLNTHFEEWKGELEQIDDVCVIGVRI
ncbi:MAG: SpoIIE family protein phosphatase [Flavobacteriales bacterium]|nr:SpoIIE family protein phosphatase [Flavobacteriales bacterium]